MFYISEFNTTMLLILAVMFVICLGIFAALTFVVEKYAPPLEKKIEKRRREKRISKHKELL